MHANRSLPAVQLSTETNTTVCNGNSGHALRLLAAQAKAASPENRRFFHQIRERIWLDTPHQDDETMHALFPQISLNGKLDGPSTLVFADLMLDTALLLHRKGDSGTAFALLRKLLKDESEPVEASEMGNPSTKPTNSTSVNDFIHLFLAQSNTPPPLPPESRARALRILAEVLLAQGR